MPKSARKPVGGVKPTPGSTRSGKRPAKAPASSARKIASKPRDGGASAALTMPPPSTKRARKQKPATSSKKWRKSTAAHVSTDDDDDDDDAYVDDGENVDIPQARMHTVPETVAKKWTPIAATTKKLFTSTMDSVLGMVLGGFSGSDSRGEAEKHLLALKHRIVESIDKSRGPPVPKRRKIGFAELSETTRKQEASLLVCHQQIRKLESELTEQRTLLEEDEAHLDKYLTSMKSATSHSRKQHKQKLHPLLRKAELQTVDSSVAPATVPSAGGVEGVESDDDVDEDILELRDEIHQKLSAMQFQVKDAQAWLHAAHRSSVPDSAVDTAE